MLVSRFPARYLLGYSAMTVARALMWVLLVILATPVPCDEAQAELADDAAQHGSFHPPLAIQSNGVYFCHLPSSCDVARPSLVRDVVNAEVRVVLVGVKPTFSYQVVAELPSEQPYMKEGTACRGDHNVTIPAGGYCCCRASLMLRGLWSFCSHVAPTIGPMQDRALATL